MVYAVHELLIEVDTTPNGTATYKKIADLETAEININGNMEEWTPLDTEGFARRLRTGISQDITFSGKRNKSDDGNNFIASLKYEIGEKANTTIKITVPGTTPEVLTVPCVIDVTSIYGGDSTSVGSLEFTALSNGKITVA